MTCNRKCDGYLKRIFFEDEDDGAVRYRQVLFSDDEREHMTVLMTTDVPLDQASTVLTEMSDDCEEALERSDSPVNIRRGPFSAFTIGPSDSEHRIAMECSDSINLSLPTPPLMDRWTAEPPEDFVVSPLLTYDPHLTNASILGLHQCPAPDPRQDDPLGDLWFSDTPVGNPAPTAPDLKDAPRLLKHYANDFIPSLTPFRHQKTPWHVLFLSNVMHTLTAVAISDNVDSANLTNLYGILAISALDLHHLSGDPRWRKQAEVLKRNAQEHLVNVQNRALEAPKAFKYKSTVMAILTMVQISMIDGSWAETEFLILEAEKVVRLRGLMRRGKSRKVRMLHHCYVYLRVFHESLSLPSMQSNKRLAIVDTLERSGAIPAGQDNLSFHVRSWTDLKKQFQVSKNRDFGENDLHLSVPGLWPPTLYPEIFGVSEIWLMLLSQVIRLSNEKELPTHGLGASQLSIKEYTTYAKSLEMLILQWDNSAAKTIDQIEAKGDQAMDVDWILLEAMHNGMRHALAIYFYRRIYDVEPEVMQPHVVKVKESLSVCNQFYETNRRSIHGLLWAAFIAGCEAVDVELQDWFLDWFDSNLMRSPASLDARMRKVMQQVWEQRRQSPTSSMTWIDFFKKTGERATTEDSSSL